MTEVGGENAHVTRGDVAERLIREHRERVRLLAARASGAPDPHRTLQRGEDRVAQVVEVRRLTQEAGLVGRERIDHLGELAPRRLLCDEIEIRVEVGQIERAEPLGQTRAHEPFLAFAHADSRVLMEQLGDSRELCRRNFAFREECVAGA